MQAIAVSLPSTNELPDESVSQPSNEVELESQAVVEPEPVAVASSEIRLTLSFTGECWTEITDANGRRLFFDLGRDGRNVNVSGQAPLSVLFGNADSVSVQVNGSDYAISPADRRGETASFTISSP